MDPCAPSRASLQMALVRLSEPVPFEDFREEGTSGPRSGPPRPERNTHRCRGDDAPIPGSLGPQTAAASAFVPHQGPLLSGVPRRPILAAAIALVLACRSGLQPYRGLSVAATTPPSSLLRLVAAGGTAELYRVPRLEPWGWRSAAPLPALRRPIGSKPGSRTGLASCTAPAAPPSSRTPGARGAPSPSSAARIRPPRSPCHRGTPPPPSEATSWPSPPGDRISFRSRTIPVPRRVPSARGRSA